MQKLFQQLENEYLPLKTIKEKQHEEDTKRIKQYDVKQGEYSSSIYIEVPRNIEIKLQQESEKYIESLEIKQQFHRNKNLHISLSKEFQLREYQMKVFLNEIKKRVKQMKSFCIQFDSFEMMLNPLRNTQFLTLRVINDEIEQLVSCIDEVMNDFQLEQYHKDHKFHSSIMYSLDVNDEIPNENESKNQFDYSIIQECSFRVTHVKVSIGNHIYSMPLLIHQ